MYATDILKSDSLCCTASASPCNLCKEVSKDPWSEVYTSIYTIYLCDLYIHLSIWYMMVYDLYIYLGRD